MNVPFVLTALRRYWYVLIGCVIIGMAASAAVSSAMPKKYEARTQLLLTIDLPENAEPSSGNAYVRDRIATYSEFVGSDIVIDAARSRLGLDESTRFLANRIKVAVEPDTVILTITATWNSPEEAAEVVNAVARSFAELTPQLDNQGTGGPVLNVTIFDPATVPTQAAPPFPVPIVLLGAIGGLAIGLLLTLFFELRNPYVRSLREFADSADSKVLATLGPPGHPDLIRAAPKDRERPKSGHDEADAIGHSIAALYTRIGLNTAETYQRVITITSANPSLGSAPTAWELARTASASGLHCVVVAGDPSARAFFEDRIETEGLAPGRADPELLPPELLPLPSGGVLGLRSLRAALRDLAANADVVLIAAPPVLDDPNVHSYLQISHGVVLLAPSRRSRYSTIRASSDLIRAADAELLGVVAVSTKGPIMKTPRQHNAVPLFAKAAS
ncbi:hypothetical protein LWF01_16705 [Saxibacter everestensis]|uniref:Polysaccharide chain length determinant N-terminal domain-containing protein n=1 Tax=Saxibacter everestensis TaxID=2909229 RepID=A0ABY8QRV0_9MICO|nr:hypothetical protein LWF01_16705 [Brevibacteriaceae bacterium ZFBP1038]